MQGVTACDCEAPIMRGLSGGAVRRVNRILVNPCHGRAFLNI
jgi:hypothetical protein